ncbi:MAG: elongation factor G [Desulfovibrio sp.]|nr:MAG: elongation factor G [Desulfovibrio sp.]
MSKKAYSKKYLDKLRNIGIIAHIDAGKTTLTERILYYSDTIHRMGEVHDGAATMDYMPEEQERGITITSACTTTKWRGISVNIIDTPGHVDFTIEVERSLRVLDGAVGVFCAVGGVEPQSETVWRQSEKFDVPKLAFVNKMDRPGADFEACLEAMRTRLKARPLALQIPIGAGPEFEGVIDVVRMERLLFDAESLGRDYERRELSDSETELAEPWREKLIETLAEENEELLEQYLGGEEIDVADLEAGIAEATRSGGLVPVFAGTALKNVGVQPVMDAIMSYLPSPVQVQPAKGMHPKTKDAVTLTPSPDETFAALVFKVSMETGRRVVLLRVYSGALEAGGSVLNQTQGVSERAARLFRLHAGQKSKTDVALAGEIVAVAGMKHARTGDTLCDPSAPVLLESLDEYKPVISLALEPKSTADGDRLDEVLEKFLVEDPTLYLENDEDTGQRVLSGMGELHLEVILERMRREYNVEPRAGKPQVVFQETVSRKADGEAEFHRELGEVMHHGFVALSVEPMARDTGTDTVFEIDVQAFNQAWVDAVAQGVHDSLQSGVLKGYPVRDVRVRIKELRRREGESSPAGFHMAAVNAVKQALGAASPVLLEPIMDVEISVPEEFVGDAVGLLGAKGAKVENIIDRAGQKVVQALTPMRQLFGFSTELRSVTQGRAGLVIRFARFDVLE